MPQDAHPAPGATGDPADPTPFRLAVVPGVNPAKWLRVWEQRLPDVRLELVPVPAAGAAAPACPPPGKSCVGASPPGTAAPTGVPHRRQNCCPP